MAAMRKLDKRLKVGKKNLKFTVEPCSARPDDTLTWHSQETEFAVWIPEPGLVMETTPVWSDAKTGEVVLTIGKNAEPGIHKYAVYCKADGEFSEGSANPVLIIEDERP